MKTTNPCLKFDSFLLLSSQPDLVALGKENGYEFTQEELNTGWKELQESDEGLTEFELDVVSGGGAHGGGS